MLTSVHVSRRASCCSAQAGSVVLVFSARMLVARAHEQGVLCSSSELQRLHIKVCLAMLPGAQAFTVASLRAHSNSDSRTKPSLSRHHTSLTSSLLSWRLLGNSAARQVVRFVPAKGGCITDSAERPSVGFCSSVNCTCSHYSLTVQLTKAGMFSAPRTVLGLRLLH